MIEPGITFGNDLATLEYCMVKARILETPKVTLAGKDLLSSQNEIQLISTMQ